MNKIINPEEISDHHEGMGRELPFRVPDHYFEDFQARFTARLEAEESGFPGKRVSLFSYVKPVLGLAAAFAAVFLLVYLPVRLMTSQDQLASTGISGEEETIINLVEYVDDHTFFSLLNDDGSDQGLEGNDLEVFIASNYSDYDIFLETQK
jgi:hypothetical protein